MRREAAKSMETALTSRTQSQAEEARLKHELEETKQRSKEEVAALRDELKAMERQSHDFEVEALRAEGIRRELESLRQINDRLMHEKEVEGSLSPTLVMISRYLLYNQKRKQMLIWLIECVEREHHGSAKQPRRSHGTSA